MTVKTVEYDMFQFLAGPDEEPDPVVDLDDFEDEDTDDDDCTEDEDEE